MLPRLGCEFCNLEMLEEISSPSNIRPEGLVRVVNATRFQPYYFQYVQRLASASKHSCTYLKKSEVYLKKVISFTLILSDVNLEIFQSSTNLLLI